MPDEYVNTRLGPQDLESGRVLAPGETVPASGLNLKVVERDDGPPLGLHDSRLIEEGVLLKVEPAAPAKPRPSEEASS